ncbi:hypothetical protein [Rhodoferax antarcticus]|uniref:Uncharacterized protein n=1 Tax=Rhodoferax antarcticus ANT.BR TaxID=1111071 RepID=A0A1Q8YIV4_9BURK|nr:hypothetical protein [Rhodoferax antarcticus]APW48086.1 hypothetical protein RA876_19050 [Rhodoferax antarcticus]MCW2313420.1 hypothetical protein [Rhodoferax antarcticus]OLP07942.1 hypothetical protein BLL52_1040 [Rhodoferax antarcticus ANT.BR]
MSLFSWLFSKPAPAAPSGLSADAFRGAAPKSVPAPTSVDPLVDLKHQRHERREHLYDVVRSVMLRSEVLASHYKFKVLSLDARGRQFLVMIDLLGEDVLSPERWLPIEQLMTMTAAQRHDLQVKSVYWRMLPAQAGQTVKAAAAFSAPVVAEAMPAKVVETGVVAGEARHGFDPIDNDEVMAFKRAISDATPEEQVAAKSGRVVTSGPRKPAPQPGYEDTQLLEPDDAASPLSRTQFGGLD